MTSRARLILPVFPAWSFSQYHDLHGVFIHASPGSPLDTLLSFKHHGLHGWWKGKKKRDGYKNKHKKNKVSSRTSVNPEKLVDSCDALSLRVNVLADFSMSRHQCKKTHHGLFIHGGKRHLCRWTEEKNNRTASWWLANISVLALAS